MQILAIETTGKYGSAAVIGDNGTAYSMYSKNEMNHLQDIISISDAAIKSAGITKKDLTYVAASIGPGSFTGIRIGVTTARTLAQMLEIPCIAVSTLDGMREGAVEAAKTTGCKLVLATINARRHQTYAAVWKTDEKTDEFEVIFEENQYIIDELLEKIAGIDEKVYIIGDGIDAYQEIIEEKLPKEAYFLAKEDNRYQNAKYIAKIALNKAKSGEIMQYFEVFPNYMRLSEAEQRLKEGKLSKKIK